MATGSGLFISTFRDALDTSNLGLDLQLTSHKFALFNSTAFTAITYSEDPARYGTAPFASNEVYGTNWAQGGVLLSAAASGGSVSPSLAIASGVGLKYSMSNVVVNSTTLSAFRCMLLYADALTNNEAILCINFGTDYTTNNGAVNVVWGQTGVFTIDMTP